MNRGDVAIWAALLALGIAFEAKELREGVDGVPLSRVIRSTFHTQHPVGRWVFRTAVWAGSGALIRHINTTRK